jgi:hypothetical protein
MWQRGSHYRWAKGKGTLSRPPLPVTFMFLWRLARVAKLPSTRTKTFAALQIPRTPSARIWFDFEVNGEHRRFPVAGTRDLRPGSSISLPQGLQFFRRYRRLAACRGSGHGRESTEKHYHPADRSPTGRPVTQVQDKHLTAIRNYEGANNFGRGFHTERSTTAFITEFENESLEVTYRVDAADVTARPWPDTE